MELEKLGHGIFNLTQSSLTNKVLSVAKMTDCISVHIPSSTVPLGIDADVVGFSGDCEYATIVGILMYLANQTWYSICGTSICNVHSSSKKVTCNWNKENFDTCKILKISDSYLVHLTNSNLTAI